MSTQTQSELQSKISELSYKQRQYASTLTAQKNALEAAVNYWEIYNKHINSDSKPGNIFVVTGSS